MVKLYGPLVSLTLITSLVLALPHPPYTHIRDGNSLERNLDEKFSGREISLDEFVDLVVREPSFLRHFKKAFNSVARVAVKGLHLVEKVADNPFVQAAVSIIPGGGALVAAQKVAGTIGQVEKFERQARQGVNQIKNLGGAIRTVDKAIKTAKVADRKVNRLIKHLPVPVPVRGALGRVKAKAITQAKHVLARHIRVPRPRHHRRDLEDDEELSRRDLDDEELSQRDLDDDEELLQRDLDDEELSRRDLDAEELFDREYDDDFLVERDYFDDLD